MTRGCNSDQTESKVIDVLGMVDTFGDALRLLREAAGLTIPALAAKVNYSKGYLGNVETGERRPTSDLADACDRELNVGGFLVLLAACERAGGDDMMRRTLLSGLAMLNGMALLKDKDATKVGVLADAVRASLAAALGTRSLDEWLALCEEHGRRCMTEPPAEMQPALLGDLLVLRQQLPDDDRKELRAVAAKLAILYGMTIASIGDTQTAVGWYWAAKRAADASEDQNLRAWVRGREVLRSDYDGYATPDRILAFVRNSSGLADGPSIARMEIMVAAARAYARIGEHEQAHDAYERARHAYDAISHQTTDAESMYYLPEWRFRLRGAFVYAMAGDIAAVDRITTEVAAARPAGLLRWGVQIDLNRALAVARAGDHDTALAMAVPTAERTPRSQHTETMRQLVGELCSTVSDDANREAVGRLRELVGTR